MQEKDTTKGRAKVCLDSTGVSGLPLCMFCTKHIFVVGSIIQLNGAKVSSLVYFSSLVEHFKLMFVCVVELSRAYVS